MSSCGSLAAKNWIGQRLEDLDTPALLLDGPASDRNLRRMAAFFADKKSKLRPHFKNNKCVTLAKRQLAAGSCVGMTCAKLGEAEVLAEHGIDNILIANQVMGQGKMERLVQVARKARLMVAADHINQVTPIAAAATKAGVTVGILVEVDIGMGRCGVAPGKPALELAQQIVPLKGVKFEGLQAYEGHTVYINDYAQRAQLTRQAMQLALDTRQLLENHGIPVHIVSGGSSSTHAITGAMTGVDEIQAGSYATMDWRYSQLIPEFEIALSILTRVISKRPGVAILDVGVKGGGGEFGVPRIKGYPQIEIPFFLAEEHCMVKNAPDEWRVGQTLHLWPSHCCTTCNLYRQLVIHDQGRIIDQWPIEGSGKLT